MLSSRRVLIKHQPEELKGQSASRTPSNQTKTPLHRYQQCKGQGCIKHQKTHVYYITTYGRCKGLYNKNTRR